jgi:hypothetical protein
MAREEKEVFDGQNWVPWIGLALVVPAIIVFLVGVLGLIAGIERTGSRQVLMGSGPGFGGIVAGSMAAIGAFAALMLGLVGLVRGLRRPAPHNGRSVGLAGFTLEIGVISLAIAALALLGVTFL